LYHDIKNETWLKYFFDEGDIKTQQKINLSNLDQAIGLSYVSKTNSLKIFDKISLTSKDKETEGKNYSTSAQV
jgi:hypothetical protein